MPHRPASTFLQLEDRSQACPGETLIGIGLSMLPAGLQAGSTGDLFHKSSTLFPEVSNGFKWLHGEGRIGHLAGNRLTKKDLHCCKSL